MSDIEIKLLFIVIYALVIISLLAAEINVIRIESLEKEISFLRKIIIKDIKRNRKTK